MLIIVCFLICGCFGGLKTDVTVYADSNTGFQSQSWFYFPYPTVEETEKKLVQRILKSSLYKACIERGDMPRATYSEPIMSSLTLTCWPIMKTDEK